MSPLSWSKAYTVCQQSRGVLLPLHNSPENQKIAKTLMSAFSVDSIFVGYQKHPNQTTWSFDYYENAEANIILSEDAITTIIEHRAIVASVLSNGSFSYSSVYGHESDYEPYNAICEFSKYI